MRMALERLPMQEGVDYRELSPEEGARKWRFVLLRDVRCALPVRVPDATFHDAGGREWMRHEGGWRILRAGYASNGCSPKRWVPGLGWIGTPDTKRTVWASFHHDGGYQFSGVRGWPLRREMEDELFLRNLQWCGFRLARMYHGAVKDFGGAFWGKNADGLEMRTLA
jgi:hypothetical protein